MSMVRTERGRAERVALAVLLLATVVSCAAPQRLSVVTGAPLANHPRVALLPIENLSGVPDAGDQMSRLLAAELSARGWCELVDIGQVQGVLRRMRARNTAVLSLDQLRALGDTLAVRYLLTGSLLERSTATTPDGPVPSVAATFKLLEASTGRVVWAKAIAITGKDRETVFGYGRETDPGRLDAQLMSTVLADFRRLTEPNTTKGGEGKR